MELRRGCNLKATVLCNAPPCDIRLQSLSAAVIAAVLSVLPSPMAPYLLTSHSSAGDEVGGERTTAVCSMFVIGDARRGLACRAAVGSVGTYIARHVASSNASTEFVESSAML